MVMENEIRLGDILDKLTPSDRVVIYNAARQVVYRGYAANAVHGTLNPQPVPGRHEAQQGICTEVDKGSHKQWLCPGHGAFILDGSYRRPEPGRKKPGHGSGNEDT